MSQHYTAPTMKEPAQHQSTHRKLRQKCQYLKIRTQNSMSKQPKPQRFTVEISNRPDILAISCQYITGKAAGQAPMHKKPLAFELNLQESAISIARKAEF